jgi:hypothetical protein
MKMNGPYMEKDYDWSLFGMKMIGPYMERRL